MKQTFVAGFGSYARAYPLGQYVVPVLRLKYGSRIASTTFDAGDAASKMVLAAWWFALPQLYWMMAISPLIWGGVCVIATICIAFIFHVHG
jgi:hypothetical protein